MNKYKLWVKTFHLNDYGEPFEMTDGQADMFRYIYDPDERRVGIKAVTQYGKSDITSMAIIHSLIDKPTKILIVSPRMKQSQIIMGYVIQHFFDHEYMQGMLEVSEPLERLKRERSKARLTLRNGSEVAILTADSRTVSQEAKSLMGFGGDVVIVDESALIPEEMFSKIFRMIGGHKYGKLVQLGNPFPSKHFEACFSASNYKTLSIDYRQAIEEKRFTQEYIDEARKTITDFDFEVFYECAFPKEMGTVFRDIRSVANARPSKPYTGHLYVMGVDLAKIQDYTAISVYNRATNSQVYHERIKDLEYPFQKRKIAAIAKHYNNALVVLDATGLGDPIADDLIRAGLNIIPFKITSVNKKEMIEKLIIWIEQKKLEILPIEDTLLEFDNFTYELSATGLVRYTARRGFHDDIVISHALAITELQPISHELKREDLTLMQQHKITSLKQRHGKEEENWTEWEQG